MCCRETEKNALCNVLVAILHAPQQRRHARGILGVYIRTAVNNHFEEVEDAVRCELVLVAVNVGDLDLHLVWFFL